MLVLGKVIEVVTKEDYYSYVPPARSSPDCPLSIVAILWWPIRHLQLSPICHNKHCKAVSTCCQ